MYIQHLLFMHPPADGRLYRFRSLALVNNAATSMDAQAPLWRADVDGWGMFSALTLFVLKIKPS